HSGHRERVTDEGAREIGHASGRSRVVAELPGSTVEGIHPGIPSCDYANRHAASDNLAVGADVRLDVVEMLSALRVRAEAGDDLVEDEGDVRFFGELADLFDELLGLEIGPAALDRL